MVQSRRDAGATMVIESRRDIDVTVWQDARAAVLWQAGSGHLERDLEVAQRREELFDLEGLGQDGTH
jgi:hypothetical protein